MKRRRLFHFAIKIAVLLILLSVSEAWRPTSTKNIKHSVALQDSSKARWSSAKNIIASAIIGVTLTNSLGMPVQPAAAVANGYQVYTSDIMSESKRLTLDQAVVGLENAQTRNEVLQGMADVYETATSKSLLAKSKYKQRIITAVNDKHRQLDNQWDQALGFASGELKRSIDPYRTVDLSGYLHIAPVVAGICYLGALFVQQSLPELFTVAYPVAVFIFIVPILFTIFTS